MGKHSHTPVAALFVLHGNAAVSVLYDLHAARPGIAKLDCTECRAVVRADGFAGRRAPASGPASDQGLVDSWITDRLCRIRIFSGNGARESFHRPLYPRETGSVAPRARVEGD